MSFASHEANLRYFKYLFSSNAYNVNSLYKATKMNIHPNIETIGATLQKVLHCCWQTTSTNISIFNTTFRSALNGVRNVSNITNRRTLLSRGRSSGNHYRSPFSVVSSIPSQGNVNNFLVMQCISECPQVMWFTLVIPVSSCNKTNRHNITKIILKLSQIYHRLK